MKQPRSSANREFTLPPPVADSEDVDEIDHDDCLTYIAYVRFGPNSPFTREGDCLRGGGGESETDQVAEEPDGNNAEDESLDFDDLSFEPTWCPNGHSSTVVRNGRGRRGEQRYLCRECGMSFTVLTGTIFEGRKFSLPEMVFLISRMDETDALSLAGRVPRSYRSVRSFLKAVRAAEDSPLVEAFRANGHSPDSDDTASES